MPALLRPVFTALGIACLLSAASLASSGTAFAQAKPAQQAAPAQAPALKQIALTDKQLDGVLAAQKDMDAVTEKLPENAAPDQKVIGQLDGVAKKNGFAGYDDYNNVVDNISLVLGGFDPATKKYVGTEAVIKAQIAQVPGRQEDAGQRQEGSARRAQRRAEDAVPPDREQGQHRSRRQVL
ncbi:hypothetical protein ACVWWK_002433 [Bradyrhizobium sp. LB9.1b]